MKIPEIKLQYLNKTKNRFKIKNSKDSYNVIRENWNDNTIELQEEFKVLLLNRNNEVLGVYNLSKGGTAGTIVDVKLLFSSALKSNASSIIIVHNHPSGNLTASTADIELTNKIKKASYFLDIRLLDHLIISKSGFYSFSDNENL